jgi:hypothetical protein
MAALIALSALGLFAAGIFAGIIGVVSVAIRMEERNLTLASGPTGYVTRTGRWLNGLYARAPHRTPAADRTTPLVSPLPAAVPRSRTT